jgi:hypothetical protein
MIFGSRRDRWTRGEAYRFLSDRDALSPLVIPGLA